MTIALVGCADLALPRANPARVADVAARETLVAPPVPEFPLDVEFGQALRLDGVSVARGSVPQRAKLRLWLYWTAIAQSSEDLRSVGSLVADNGRVVAREDDQIGGRRHVLSAWAVGERNVDEMEITVGRSTRDGEYALAISVLRADKQTPVPISSRPSQAVALGEAAVAVTTIAVAPS
jgi:hypothetical protein